MRLLHLTCIAAIIICGPSTLAQSVEFEVQDPQLIPEGITVDSVSGKFYISSIAKNKIIEVSDGSTTDFIQPGQYGFVGGLGIHVDAVHHILWACSGDFNGQTYTTGIFAFDLMTHKPIHKFFLPADTAKNFFNDLAIADNGDVFITNTDNNSIWYWKFKADHPEKMKLEGVTEPNGIVWNKSRRVLFIATRKGLMSLSPGTLKLNTLPNTGSETSDGLDGLVMYKNSIVAVRNGFRDRSRHGVLQFYLSPDGQTIVKIKTIDQLNPLFDIPTTLAIRGNQLFVIGNSKMDLLDDQKRIDPRRAPKNPIILRYTLSR